jgi:predicted metal-dependent phosphoesterase TrpH
MTDLQSLVKEWLESKATESQAVQRRREIEDQLKALTNIPEDLDGTKTLDVPGYVVKVTGRIDRKVDADLVQEIAAEHGLDAHLSTLLRWKPELNMTAWKAADEAITRQLSSAITAKPGRPSFAITTKEK